LAFDCLIIDDQNVMARSLDKRYGVRYLKAFSNQPDQAELFDLQRLTEWFYKPYAKMIFDHPHVLENQPFGYVGQFIVMSKGIYAIVASKSKKSVFLTMSRRSSLSTFQLSNTATMGLSTPALVRHTHLEQIPTCETFFFVYGLMHRTQLFMFQTKVEASI
jgi:hypothetical protein